MLTKPSKTAVLPPDSPDFFVTITLLLEQLLGKAELTGVHKWDIGDLKVMPTTRAANKSPARGWPPRNPWDNDTVQLSPTQTNKLIHQYQLTSGGTVNK